MAAAFEFTEIEELLALMERWEIAELHLSVGDASLDLVRALAAAVPETEHPAVFAPRTEAAPPLCPETREHVMVNAPVVGVFHLAQRGFPAGAPRIGDQVQAGQLVGTIELMHVPTDLISPVSGCIADLLTSDGSGVEYGQPLLAINPYEEVSEDEAGMLPPPTR